MAIPASDLQQAKVLTEVGELYDAEAVVAEILDAHPEDRTALDLLAKIKHMRGGLSQAIACWAKLYAEGPQSGAALARLGALLQLARDPERGAGEFLAVGQFQLWRKPAAHLEMEEVFRLFLARRPDQAREACQRLAAKHRGKDQDAYKLASLAEAWIAELSGDVAAAAGLLEELGLERGFETDNDRVIALARVYEQLGTREHLEKATHIYHFLERNSAEVSVLGSLASLYRRLEDLEAAARYEDQYLQAFRRWMHRPTTAEAVEVAARDYIPLEKLRATRFAPAATPAEAPPRERALALALAGGEREAAEHLREGTEALDKKYLADLEVVAGRADAAVRLYLSSLEQDPDDLRVVGWLLEHHGRSAASGAGGGAFPAAALEHRSRSGPEMIADYFRQSERGERTRGRLETALRVAPLRSSLWRQLASLHVIGGRAEEAARCLARATRLDEARRRERPVGRVLAAAVYHFVGTAKGLIHEVWAARKPVEHGRGGFLGEILGNLTSEMSQAVRNTFLSVREFARSRFPVRTADIFDYEYTYKVTKEDEPSGGLSADLPAALAFLSVFLDRPAPQDVACSGVLIADSHDVLVLGPVGEAEYKVRGAYNRNLRMLILPAGNRKDLESSPLVPRAVCDEIVRYASSLEQAVSLTFGEDVWLE
jgi:tetratricopeptide (TPR) repeat protein